MKRRSFLATTAAAAVGTQVLGGVPLKAFTPMNMPVHMQPDDDRCLIVVQLFGGNDGLNTIIPVEDPQYYSIRPTIAVPKEKAISVLSRVHMHPALAPKDSYGFPQMFEDGRLAIVQGIGYENPNLSHFRSTDIWLSGFNSSDPEVRLLDGWLGRYWSNHLPGFPEVLPPDPIAVQIGGSLSMLLQSPKGDVGIALTDPQKFFELGQGLSPDMTPMSEETRYGREFNFVRTVAEQCDRYSSVVKNSFDKGKNVATYADGNFVKQMQLVARLISGGLKSKIFLVYMGGFDTHVMQQDEYQNGLHPYLLGQLASGIGSFMQDALAQGFADRVVGMTVSEFGRRPYENGSRGTDHGAASVQFVFGNGVRAGVYGQSPDLTNFDGNGDVRYQWDYRRVYADVLENWFGGTMQETEDVLQDRVLPLGVLQRTTSVDDAYEGRFGVDVRIAPNPATSQASIEWYQPVNSVTTVEVYANDGRHVKTLLTDRLAPGPQRVEVADLTSGAYLCCVMINGVRSVAPLSIVR
ncbi:MAG: DUF1501 domain-containing protein [Candidatus Kapabacteria bacterium]|nr:DUF1501 domain-containing protein [Candidatus Kapabacteria bacterium]